MDIRKSTVVKNPIRLVRPTLIRLFTAEEIFKRKLFLFGLMRILLIPDKVRIHSMTTFVLTMVKRYPACPRSVLPWLASGLLMTIPRIVFIRYCGYFGFKVIFVE